MSEGEGTKCDDSSAHCLASLVLGNRARADILWRHPRWPRECLREPPPPPPRLTGEQRRAFAQNGYLVVRGAVPPDRVAALRPA